MLNEISQKHKGKYIYNLISMWNLKMSFICGITESRSWMVVTRGEEAGEMGDVAQRVQSCSCIGWVSFGDLIYSMVTLVNNIISSIGNLLRVDLRCSHHTHTPTPTHTHTHTTVYRDLIHWTVLIFHYIYENIMLYTLNVNNFYFKREKKKMTQCVLSLRLAFPSVFHILADGTTSHYQATNLTTSF